MGAAGTIVFARDEIDLIAALAGCSLDEEPGSNWVQEAGGLPEYICEIARAIRKTGKSVSQAISIAVSRVKVWATGKGVNAKTQAKASAAVAEWEKLRAKSHAKAAKNKVKASNAFTETGVLVLAASTDYNTDIVRSAFNQKMSDARNAWYKANPNPTDYKAMPPYMYVRELWTKFLIVKGDDDDGGRCMYKVPYTVDAKLNVDFGDPQKVTTQYVAVPQAEIDDTGLTDQALAALAEAQQGACMFSGPVAFSALGESALQRILRYTAAKTGK